MVIPPPTLPPCLAQVHDDRFHLGVLLDPLVASLAPETGFLEPPERDLVGVAGGVVGPDEPGLEALAHPDGAPLPTPGSRRPLPPRCTPRPPRRPPRARDRIP